MDNSRCKMINKLAEDLVAVIEEQLSLKFPFDLEEIIKELGGEIEEEEIAEGGYAKIVKTNESGFKITIDPYSSFTLRRNRFSIAHELGHLLLHMHYLDKIGWQEVPIGESSSKYRFGRGLEEREANEFAASFLMPEEKFRAISEQYCKDGYYYVDKIADYFDVSFEAATYRGVNLNIWTR